MDERGERKGKERKEKEKETRKEKKRKEQERVEKREPGKTDISVCVHVSLGTTILR